MAKQTRRYLLDYDASQNPPVGTDARAEVFSGLIDVHKRGAHILEKKDPFVYPSSDIIVVGRGTIIALYNNLWRTFEIHQDIELGAGDIDDGGDFQVGKDYYIYLVDDNGGGQLVISANATFPNGATADASRKIGGFHYGHIRCTNSRYAPIDSNGVVYGDTGTIWQNNVVVGIVPNSVWDLKNRPSCSPEGMVCISSRWVDIYLASVAEPIVLENNYYAGYVAGGLLQSKYGQLPRTHCSWYVHQELAARLGKRLQAYAEFVQSAAGNPGGQDDANDYGWTAATNDSKPTRTGCGIDPSTGAYDALLGIKPYAISAYNLVDTVGNAAELVNDTSIRDAGSTTLAWQDSLGTDKGQLYAYTSGGFPVVICGGSFNDGTRCGGRTAHIGINMNWQYNGVSARFACDALVV
jgi:hypothetical protein